MNSCRNCLLWVGRRIGEFFGVADHEETNIQWRNNFIEKAQAGEVGFSLSHVSHSVGVQYQKDKVIKQLEASISQVIVDTDDVGMSNHILGKSSHFLMGAVDLREDDLEMYNVTASDETEPQDIEGHFVDNHNFSSGNSCDLDITDNNHEDGDPNITENYSYNNNYEQGDPDIIETTEGDFYNKYLERGDPTDDPNIINDYSHKTDDNTVSTISFSPSVKDNEPTTFNSIMSLPFRNTRQQVTESFSGSDEFYDANTEFNQSIENEEEHLSFSGMSENVTIAQLSEEKPLSIKLNNFVSPNFSSHVSCLNVFKLNCTKNKELVREVNKTVSVAPKNNTDFSYSHEKSNFKRNQVCPVYSVDGADSYVKINNINTSTKGYNNKLNDHNDPANSDWSKSNLNSNALTNDLTQSPIDARRENLQHRTKSILKHGPSSEYSIKGIKHLKFDAAASMGTTSEADLSSGHNFGHRGSSSMIGIALKSSNFWEEYDVLGEEDVRLTGKEAFDHYIRFKNLEREMKLKELNETKDWIIENYKWRINMVKELSNTAKGYYANPKGEMRKMWKTLRKDIKQKSQHSLTDISVQQAELKQFTPYFTYFIILVHIMVFSILTSIGGIASIGLEQNLYLHENIQTFIGIETIHRWDVPNIWIGPDMKYMIKFGAVYAPCIRGDISIQLEYVQKYGSSTDFGCCEVLMRNTAGTTTENECSNFTNGVGVWKSEVMCSERTSGQNSVAHNLRPCCINLKASCQLTSHEHCLFVNGIFFSDKDHCTQVNCFDGLCGSITMLESTSGFPVSPNQIWRIFISLFYCHGLIHLLLLLCVEWLIMRLAEKSTGWFRLFLIFVISGTASVVTASIISPYTPQVGSTGAVFGSAGIAIIEVAQAWKIIKKPWKELIKIICVVTFFLLSGMLPLVSNFSVITGVTMGILSAMLFLPYITLGGYAKHGRIVLIIISLPLLFMMFFVLFFTYTKVQNAEGCVGCNNFECTPFTDKICQFE